LGGRRTVRALLLLGQAPVTAVWRSGGLAVGVSAVVLTAGPPVRLTAQDTSAIDRGVRIGIIYRPGVRPGMVVLPVHAPALDSVRTIVSRDLDYSDRFELITLPGGDSIRVTAAAPGARVPAPGGAGRGTGGGGAAAATTLNYPLYQALGADFAVAVTPAPGDTTIVTVHDVAAAGVRRELRARLPALKDPGFRLVVHQLADRVLEAALGVGGTAATRVLFVMDGKVYTIDQDGADQRLVSSSDHQAMSPAWAADGRRFAYMEFWQGHGKLFVQEVASGKRAPVTTTGQALDFTPEWSPDGQTVAFHRDVGGTLQVFVLDVRTRAVRQLTSVGRNEDPTWAPDSRHMAFVSDRSGYRQLWIIDVETGRIRPLLQKSGARLPAWSPRLPETASSTP